MYIEASVIIAIYNKFDFLQLVLAGFENQTFKNFEIILADDGSSPEVVEKIKNKIAGSKLEIKHVWHEDKGWRKNIILNKAIVESRSGYLIFVDGDCIPHKRFVEEHIKNKQENIILAGRRVNLPEKITFLLSPQKIKKGLLHNFYLIYSFWLNLFGYGSHIEKGLYIKNKFIRKFINNKERGLLGSNFSIHKADILKINGFDERFLYPAAGEDTDLENRLKNNGVKLITLKYIAVQYHLYHQELYRDPENIKILDENIKNKVTFTPFGINKLNEWN